MRHLILQTKLSRLMQTACDQLWPPLQVWQSHMLKGQAVCLLEVLDRRERVAAASLDGRLLAEVKVVHAVAAQRVGMV